MIETSAAVHPIFDPTSLISDIRGVEAWKLGFFFWHQIAWGRASRSGLTMPTASERSPEELAELTRRLGSPPKTEAVDAKPIRWRFPDEEPSDGAMLCICREWGEAVATLLLPPLDIDPPARCRAYLIDADIAAKLQVAVGDRPWIDAFRPEVLADNEAACKALRLAPEFGGEWDERGGTIRFRRVRAEYGRFLLPALDSEMVAVLFVEPS